MNGRGKVHHIVQLQSVFVAGGTFCLCMDLHGISLQDVMVRVRPGAVAGFPSGHSQGSGLSDYHSSAPPTVGGTNSALYESTIPLSDPQESILYYLNHSAEDCQQVALTITQVFDSFYLWDPWLYIHTYISVYPYI